MNAEKEQAEILVDALLIRLNSILEEVGRRKTLLDFIRTQPPEIVIEMLNIAFFPKGSAAFKFKLFIDTFTHLLIAGVNDEKLSYSELTEYYKIAREKGYENVARLFLTPPPAKVMDDTEKTQLHQSVSETTAGMRRSIAKGDKMNLIGHLTKDTDPVVIRNILFNPKTVESDVLKIASRRPTTAAVLEEISKNPKWKNNYRVKKALVFNPYTPTSISVNLVFSLMLPDIKLCVQTLNLHRVVIEAARGELERRTDVKNNEFQGDASEIATVESKSRE